MAKVDLDEDSLKKVFDAIASPESLPSNISNTRIPNFSAPHDSEKVLRHAQRAGRKCVAGLVRAARRPRDPQA